jgi:DNA-binding MarR family transcriptional regulator
MQMENTHSERDRSLGLEALLSALLVAFTIEFDNEFEHRMPHRTTRHGRSDGTGPRPWLVSMAMWVHVMRLVPEAGISGRDLVLRSQLSPETTRGMTKRLGEWWGYLDIRPGPGGHGTDPPRSERLVRPTEAGRIAQGIWRPLAHEVEERWNDRFGPGAMDDLRSSLSDVLALLDIDPPDYLPVGKPRLRSGEVGDIAQLPLTALLSKVLFALAIDFDDCCDLFLDVYTATVASRLPICANVLRIIGDDGTAVAELPGLSGVAKMVIDNWVGSLDKHGYLTMATESDRRRRRVARLTPKGVRARDAYLQWTASIERRWPTVTSSAELARLRKAAEALVGDPGPGSPLWKGMEPYADGWRSQVTPRQVLPHFPVVTHKGGFPDGS